MNNMIYIENSNKAFVQIRPEMTRSITDKSEYCENLCMQVIQNRFHFYLLFFFVSSKQIIRVEFVRVIKATAQVLKRKYS